MESTTSAHGNQRFVCIHGHFYQPPRENPWLEAVETQDSAAPYHDWNERITTECYAANGAARVVDGRNRIIRILNNYARMSFNFGPTLLSWMEEHAPVTYNMILRADRLSLARFNGHGSAMAQVYNHIIMPLANHRDRETQILWGIADFEHRFHRKPEGMWLAETAVDLDSLDLMARHGIRFTVLAPHQCARVRPLHDSHHHATRHDGAHGGGHWTETPDASVDSTQPYLVRLREGRSIAVFFYNGPVSRAIAFEGLLNSGDQFAHRLTGAFREGQAGPQLVHVATDGESYGHHHRHGEMALAYAMQRIEEGGSARLTNYGEYLALFPPKAEAQIHENTAWSCFHGVERWRSDCGCGSSAAAPSQKWRTPLREGLDWLRNLIDAHLPTVSPELFRDVDRARNDYIRVILDRSRHNADAFLHRQSGRKLNQAERTRALELMEMERNALLMYTSCGWFFEDISGIETVQVIAYAARALELASRVFNLDKKALERELTERLSAAASNHPRSGTGAAIYASQIGPMAVGLEQVTAHHAISALFPGGSRSATRGREVLFCYTVEKLRERSWNFGAGQLVLSKLCVRSRLTEEEAAFASAVLHFGDQNITAAVKQYSGTGEKEIDQLQTECSEAIAAGNLLEVVHGMDRVFGPQRYALTSLFRDEQRRVLQNILRPTIEEVESSLTAVYTRHASLLDYLSRAELPKPAWVCIAAQMAIHSQLRRALNQEHIDIDRVLELLERARIDMVVLETEELELLANTRMRDAMLAVERVPGSVPVIESACSLAEGLQRLPFAPNLWEAQNIWYAIFRSGLCRRPALTPAQAEWCDMFHQLGGLLSIQVEEIAANEAKDSPDEHTPATLVFS